MSEILFFHKKINLIHLCQISQIIYVDSNYQVKSITFTKLTRNNKRTVNGLLFLFTKQNKAE